MFNISLQFPVTLSLSTSLLLETRNLNLYSFLSSLPSASLSLCSFISPAVTLRTGKGTTLRFFSSLCAFASSRPCVESFIFAFLAVYISLSGGSLPYSRHAKAKTLSRQYSPSFPPPLCHNGVAPPTSRRTFFTKIDNPAPTSRVLAVASAAIFSTFSKLMKIVMLVWSFAEHVALRT
jgi:hypothetical protein